jgi:transmembrane sensor
MTPSNEQIRLAIAEQAIEWFEENRRGPLDREARSRFMAWLTASPMHVDEYLVIAGLARRLHTAANTTEIPLEPLLARVRARRNQVLTLDSPVSEHAHVTSRPRVSRPWTLAAAAALALVALATVWWTRDGQRFGLPMTYSTGHGEQSVRLLPDGSVLHLNTESQVTVHYSRRERAVDLDRGQAFFQVRHEGERGFRVAAGDAQVLSVGTEFEVYRRSGVVRVTVVEGVVAVYMGPSPMPTKSLPPGALRLGAGYQVDVRDQVGTPQPVDARAAVAWLRRQIVFENEPLEEVAAEFNRYGALPIEIETPALRALVISGVFAADDPETFIAFLRALDGVTVETTPTRIRVLGRSAAAPP